MNAYLIDSSIFISVLRKKQAVIALYKQLPGVITTSSVCLAELYEGVYKSKDPEQSREELEELLRSVQYVFPFSEKEAQTFGRAKAAMKRFLIPDIDMQIAATCLTQDCTLVTLDDHFKRVPGLMVYEIPA